MTLQSASLPDVTARNRKWAWAVYDWANSAVVTLVIAAVFPVYYNQVVAKDLTNAASVFAYTGAIALLLSIMAAPVIGTIGDLTGRRKRLLVVTTTAGSLAVCALLTTSSGGWVWASLLFIVIQICLNMSFALYDSLLSHVARDEERDRLSTLGYGLGYIGGGLHLAICTFLILSPKTFGLPDTETATRIALLTAGVWWFIFALPLFITVPEPAATPLKHQTEHRNPIADSFKRIGATLAHIRGYRQLFLMLVAFWLYSDGIGTIIGLSTTYGSEQLRLSSSTLIGALLLTQFVAFPYALMFGRMSDQDSKWRSFFVSFILWTAITFPLMGFFVAQSEAATTSAGLAALGENEYLSYSPVTVLTLVAINQVFGLIFCWFAGRNLVTPVVNWLTTKHAILMGVAIYALIAVWAFFTNTPGEFWLLAWLVATVQGGTQALSRSLFSTMTKSKSGEFFGSTRSPINSAAFSAWCCSV
ncbi:MAG: MFS transporter [Anaerolineae bacterium]